MQRHLLLLLLLLPGLLGADTVVLPDGDQLVIDVAATEGPVVARMAGRRELFAWSIADLIPAPGATTFAGGGWSAGWWVDPQERVLALAVHAAQRPAPWGPSPPTWLGVPRDGRPPTPLAVSVVRRRARIGAGSPFEALEFDSALALVATMQATLADLSAPMDARLHAEVALRSLGLPALALVELHAADRARTAHATAIRLLPEVRGAAAIPALLDHVATTSDGAGLAGIENLGTLGHGASLLPLVQDHRGRFRVREAAARGLGLTGDARFVAPMIALLDGARAGLVDAMIPSLLRLPGGASALESWASDSDRAERVAASCARTAPETAGRLLERLVRAGLLSTGTASGALRGTWLGRRALNRLLEDDVQPTGPLLGAFVGAPGPAAEEGLLAILDRLPAGLPPQDDLAVALRGSVAPVVLAARLERGHPGDATLVAALLGGATGLGPEARRAIVAALRRHLTAGDPALPVLVRAAESLRDRNAAALLIPLLSGRLPGPMAAGIARLVGHHPDLPASAALLDALERFADDFRPCRAIAAALAPRAFPPDAGPRLVAVISAGGAPCVGQAVVGRSIPAINVALSDWLVAHPAAEHAWWVIRALNRARDPVAVPGLEAALGGDHLSEVLDALGRLGDPGLLAIGRGLERQVASDRQLLGPLSNRPGRTPAGLLPGVLAALGRIDGAPPQHPSVLNRALNALGRIDADVAPMLRARLEAPGASLRLLADHLGKRRDRASVPRLRELLEEVEFEERDAVLTALARIGDVSIVRMLRFELSILPPGHWRERFYVRLLGTIGAERSP